MDKLFSRIPVWVWLVLAAAFILSQTVPCLAFDQQETFWARQPCGFKDVELDSGDVPKEIWAVAAKISIQNRDRSCTEPVGGRLFFVSVKYYQMDRNCRVRHLRISRGGRLIYSCMERVC